MEHELGFLDSRWVIETGSAAVRVIQSDERSFSFDDGERRRGLKDNYHIFLDQVCARIRGLTSVTLAVKSSIVSLIVSVQIVAEMCL